TTKSNIAPTASIIRPCAAAGGTSAVGNSIYIAAAQLETGPFISSYIETSSTAAWGVSIDSPFSNNYIPNSKSVLGWTFTNCALESDIITSTNASSGISLSVPVLASSAGRPFMFSFDIGAYAEEAQGDAQFYSSIGVSGTIVSELYFTIHNNTSRYYIKGIVPSTLTASTIDVVINRFSNSNPIGKFLIRNLQLSEGTKVCEYVENVTSVITPKVSSNYQIYSVTPVTSRYYFHNGVNQYGGSIVWKGQTYTRMPVETSGFEMTTKGTLPRPTLRISNLLGFVRGLINDKGAKNDLVGAKVYRKRTLHRYLDAQNFEAGASLNYTSVYASSLDFSGLNITGTGEYASGSPMSSSILNGSTYYWEITTNDSAGIYKLGISKYVNSSIIENITITGAAIWVEPNTLSSGHGAFSGSLNTVHTSVAGDTYGIVFDSSIGNLYAFKNGVSTVLDTDGIMAKPIFTGAYGSNGYIDSSKLWYPVI
ncbi:MAG: phage minor tail protein L, partial [bacterium]